MFTVKLLHLGFMALWVSGLFLLPRLYAAHAGAGEHADDHYFNRKAQLLYFWIMTPSAVLAVVMGTVLLFDGFSGAWLPAKLALVALLVLVHAYWGNLLQHLAHGKSRHRPWVFHLMVWVPLPLVMAIIALAAGKPQALPPIG